MGKIMDNYTIRRGSVTGKWRIFNKTKNRWAGWKQFDTQEQAEAHLRKLRKRKMP